MKHEFLVAPHLNQAFEPEGSSGGAGGNGITRRSFIKRTGGATVAALVAWNMTTSKVTAIEEEDGSSSDASDVTLKWEYQCRLVGGHSFQWPWPDGELIARITAMYRYFPQTPEELADSATWPVGFGFIGPIALKRGGLPDPFHTVVTVEPLPITFVGSDDNVEEKGVYEIVAEYTVTVEIVAGEE